MTKLKVGVIFGGASTEHEVSIKSANAIIDHLNKEKYEIYKIFIDKDGTFYENKKSKIDNITSYLKKLDVIFPVLHGKYGEDGTIQGMFELLNINYVGCKVLSSSIAMDKVYTKIILDKANIKQAKYIYIRKYEDKYIYIDDEFNEEIISLDDITNIVKDKLNFPVFVKPSNSGSSVGINKSKTKEELKEHIEYASKYDNKILIEEELKGKEIECAVLGNENVKASILGQIKPDEEFYSYDSKYKNNKSELIIPADINQDLSEKVRKTAIKAFKAIDGKGLSRIDFFVNDKTNEIYLNEINTMPGFTEISMYPKLWEKTDLNFTNLLDKIINLALE